MKKLLSIMTAIVLTLAVAMPVMAAGEATAKTYGDVKDITNSDTIVGENPTTNATNGKVTGAEVTTITYSAASLKTIDAGSDEGATEGRTGGYAWIGIQVSVPEGYKAKLEDDVAYQKEEVDTDNTIDRYFGVSLAKLTEQVEKGNSTLTYTKTFTWEKKDGTEEPKDSYKQTIKVVINLGGVTLYEGKDATAESKPVWTKTIYETKKAEVEAAKAEANKKQPTTTNKKVKDKTPGTGVENVYAIAGLVLAVTLAGAVVLNKRK